MVDELKVRQDTKQSAIRDNNTLKRSNETLIKNFKDDVYDAVQHIDHPLHLKQKCWEILAKYLKNDTNVNRVVIDPDIEKEYESQKTYLQNSVTSLKKKKIKDKETHTMDIIKVMHQNLDLIKEINKLRKQKEGFLKGTTKKNSKVENKTAQSAREGFDDEWEKEQIAHKRLQIQSLRE